MTFEIGIIIIEPKQAEVMTANGDADAIACARDALYDPRWLWHAAAELSAQVQRPKQCWRCEPHAVKGLFSPDVALSTAYCTKRARQEADNATSATLYSTAAKKMPEYFKILTARMKYGLSRNVHT